jgi:hypothetical protein
MANEPVKLGSALQPRLIFQEGSSITISDSGIQECSIKAICPDGKNVFNYIPAAGATYDSVFANDYLPADFKVDRSTNSSVQIDYNKGTTATLTISFKRPDPTKTGETASRKVSLDSSFVFKSLDQIAFGLDASLDGAKSMGAFGFPEPVATVKYNSSTLPNVGGALYALPGSAKTLGFPTATNITLNVKIVNWTDFTTGTGDVLTLSILYMPNPLGWQQSGISAEPVADQSFFDVTENWRTFYIFAGVSITSSVHFTGGNIPA